MEGYFKKQLSFIDLKKIKFWDYYTLSNRSEVKSLYPVVSLESLIKQRKEFIVIDDKIKYKRCRVQINGKGVVLRDIIEGGKIKTKKQQICKEDDFIVAEIDAKVGGFGIIPKNLNGAIVSSHYFLFEINKSKLLSEFLAIVVRAYDFQKQVKSTGSTNYSAIRPYHVLGYEIPLPTLQEQQEIVDAYFKKINEANQLEVEVNNIDKKIEKYLFTELGISLCNKNEKKKGLNLIEFKDVLEWGTDKLLSSSGFESKQFTLKSLSRYESLVEDVFRGKSPKYADKSDKYILNQKCNRWNKIELEFAKTVVPEWYNNIDKKFFTKDGDIIINSTGEGTIGRASYVSKDFGGLIYDSHILLLRLNANVLNPELFVELFNSDFGQSQVNQIKSAQATKQTELGVNNLMKIEIPVIEDTDKQKIIVEKIKFLKLRSSENIHKIEQLKQQANEEFEKSIFQ